jgi:hypothetical protein
MTTSTGDTHNPDRYILVRWQNEKDRAIRMHGNFPGDDDLKTWFKEFLEQLESEHKKWLLPGAVIQVSKLVLHESPCLSQAVSEVLTSDLARRLVRDPELFSATPCSVCKALFKGSNKMVLALFCNIRREEKQDYPRVVVCGMTGRKTVLSSFLFAYPSVPPDFLSRQTMINYCIPFYVASGPFCRFCENQIFDQMNRVCGAPNWKLSDGLWLTKVLS